MKGSKIMTVAASLAVCVLVAEQVQAAELFAGRFGSLLGTVDPSGLTGTTIGDAGTALNALAYDGGSDTLYGTTGAPTTTSLHVLNQSDGSITSTVSMALDWATALTWDTDLKTLWAGHSSGAASDAGASPGAVGHAGRGLRRRGSVR